MGTCSHTAIRWADSRRCFSRPSDTRPRTGVSWRRTFAVSTCREMLRFEDHTAYGQKYSIRAPLVGPSGRSANVVSVWLVRTGEERPRFVTAYREVGRCRTMVSTLLCSPATYMNTGCAKVTA